jgi:nicotinamide-nucleotide amidase
MTDSDSIPDLVVNLASLLRDQHRTFSTVESCTGGLVGAAMTELSGVSDVYLGGLITYSNMAKQMAAGVRSKSLAQHGAVSSQVAIAMAEGGCSKLLSTNSVGITGIAGPGGGSESKPVGTVWICTAKSDGEFDCRRFLFPGDRAFIRGQAVSASLIMTIQQLQDEYQVIGHELERINA